MPPVVGEREYTGGIRHITRDCHALSRSCCCCSCCCCSCSCGCGRSNTSPISSIRSCPVTCESIAADSNSSRADSPLSETGIKLAVVVTKVTCSSYPHAAGSACITRCTCHLILTIYALGTCWTACLRGSLLHQSKYQEASSEEEHFQLNTGV